MRGTSGIAGALLALLALVWEAHGPPSGQTRVVDAPEREAPLGSAGPAAPSTAIAPPATTANLFVEQSACTRTAPTVHGRRGEPASRVRCGRAGPLDYWLMSCSG